MIREFINNPYSLSSVRAYARGTWRLLGFFGRYAAATVESLSRKRFGARYIRTLLVGLSILLLLSVMTAGCAPLLLLFTFTVAGRMIVHSIEASKNRDNGSRHSMFSGELAPFWVHSGMSPAVVRTVGEPGLCYLIGLGGFLLDPVFALWLFGAGTGLLVKEVTFRSHLRQRTIDATDSRLESEQFATAVNRRVRGGGHTVDRTRPARLAPARPRQRRPRP